MISEETDSSRDSARERDFFIFAHKIYKNPFPLTSQSNFERGDLMKIFYLLHDRG